MGSQKRQGFSRGRILRGWFEWGLGAFLGSNGSDAAWGAGREATLRKCVTAPLASLTLLNNRMLTPDDFVVDRGIVWGTIIFFTQGLFEYLGPVVHQTSTS